MRSTCELYGTKSSSRSSAAVTASVHVGLYCHWATRGIKNNSNNVHVREVYRAHGGWEEGGTSWTRYSAPPVSAEAADIRWTAANKVKLQPAVPPDVLGRSGERRSFNWRESKENKELLILRPQLRIFPSSSRSQRSCFLLCRACTVPINLFRSFQSLTLVWLTATVHWKQKHLPRNMKKKMFHKSVGEQKRKKKALLFFSPSIFPSHRLFRMDKATCGRLIVHKQVLSRRRRRWSRDSFLRRRHHPLLL